MSGRAGPSVAVGVRPAERVARTEGEGAVAPDLRSAPRPKALYVHVPFCVHRCHYCDFSVARTRVAPIDAWLDALSVEIDAWFAATGWARPVRLRTLFVGGGTPSTLGPDGMRRLRTRLEPAFELDAGTEWTAEANPVSFPVETAAAWEEAGVTRVSLGVQALDDGALGWLGRLHDAARALESLRAAREAGVDDVNADLLFGLPAGVRRDLASEAGRLLDAGATHVSAYGLTVEPRTPLARQVRLGRVTPASDSRYEREYRRLAADLTGRGLIHYEVSNFARPGHECRHNWYYWNRAPYLGLGPSAHGFLPPLRLWNAFRWDRYRDAAVSGRPLLEGWERLGPRDEALERVWLGLRTRKGLAPEEWTRTPEAEARLARWERAGWLERRDGRIVATVDGWLRMDTLVTEIASD